MKVSNQELNRIIREEVQAALEGFKRVKGPETGEAKKAEPKKRETCEEKCTKEVINKKGADWKDDNKMRKARIDCMKRCKG